MPHLSDKLSRLNRLFYDIQCRNSKGICHQSRYTWHRTHSQTGRCEKEEEGEGTWPLQTEITNDMCQRSNSLIFNNSREQTIIKRLLLFETNRRLEQEEDNAVGNAI